eukprot:10159754-Karenia_brevis.AAC.1
MVRDKSSFGNTQCGFNASKCEDCHLLSKCEDFHLFDAASVRMATCTFNKFEDCHLITRSSSFIHPNCATGATDWWAGWGW